MDKQRENALVEQCRKGDRNALAELVDEYHGPIFNAAFHMLGNADEAADVTQTTFLKALEHMDSYDSRYRMFSWLYRITMNETIDTLKRTSRFGPMPRELPADEPSPLPAAERDQADRQLQAALMDLSGDLRSVIVLRYFTELSYHEIADVLEIPDKTVKSRLFAARRRLRKELQNQGILSA